jgi:hypothetical protein
MAQVTELVEALSNDQYRLRQLPRLHELRADLTAHGLDGLLRECAARELDSESAIAAFAYAWHGSILDLAIYSAGISPSESFSSMLRRLCSISSRAGQCPRWWSARFSREMSSLMS